jgi:chromosome segregation ATPase
MPSAAFTAVSDPVNLHKAISDLIVELITLRDCATDPDQKATLKELREKLQLRSLALLEQELDANTKQFKAVASTLSDAAKSAKEAQKDIQKTSDTLKQVAQALKVVDQLLGIAGSALLPI